VNEAESSVTEDWYTVLTNIEPNQSPTLPSFLRQSKWSVLLDLLQKKVSENDQKKEERRSGGVYVSQTKLEVQTLCIFAFGIITNYVFSFFP